MSTSKGLYDDNSLPLEQFRTMTCDEFLFFLQQKKACSVINADGVNLLMAVATSEELQEKQKQEIQRRELGLPRDKINVKEFVADLTATLLPDTVLEQLPEEQRQKLKDFLPLHAELMDLMQTAIVASKDVSIPVLQSIVENTKQQIQDLAEHLSIQP